MPTSFLPTNRGTTSSSKHQLDGISGLLVLVQLWVFTLALGLRPLSVPAIADFLKRRSFSKYVSTAQYTTAVR